MPKEQPTDILNNSSREVVYKRKNKRLFEKLAKETHFSYREVEALALIHRKIVNVLGPLSRLKFRDFMHCGLDYTENVRHILVDRVFSTLDTRHNMQIQVDQWVEGMSTILRGTLDERIPFAYKVYDLMKTNKLRKEQIFPMMRGCLIKHQPDEDPDESVKDLIELVLKKIDTDRDGDVAEDEFSAAVQEKSPLFLESMGPVFPPREARYAFLTTFADDPGRF